ncbi:MAG: Rid family detoxifying hydrolase [Candidatus Acidiferrales bacterium]
MLTKTIVRTEHAPSPKGPYSQGVIAGDLVYVAGQGPVDPQSGELRLGDIRSECELTLKNIEAILRASGTGLENVVQCRVYLADLKDFAAMNEIYCRFFPDNPPARTTVGAGSLLNGIKIEIDAVALAGDRKRERAHRAERSRSAGRQRNRRR